MRILFHSAGSNYSVWPEFKCSTPELGHSAFTIHHKLKSKNPIANNIWSWLVNFHRCPNTKFYRMLSMLLVTFQNMTVRLYC